MSKHVHGVRIYPEIEPVDEKCETCNLAAKALKGE